MHWFVNDGKSFTNSPSVASSAFFYNLVNDDDADVKQKRVSGHIGRDETIEAISRYFCSPRLALVVTFVMRQCPICQRFKGRPKGGAPLYRRIPETPYEDYAADLLELPPGQGNVMYLLVGIDTYTKFTNAVPLRNKRSAAVAKAHEERIFGSLVKVPETVTWADLHDDAEAAWG
ncbi:hypothetical protein HAZT_HAZT000371 [Hyalella azteca]|uniref:RNA-directed DNA polymerase n=1 Tax=Hyalella azteca TaxID=294128 RepID=A0A6A0HBH9_HYAAZ|nr:hypothetical protein HAZT_HAZT000371 [Hyalella azteca]